MSRLQPHSFVGNANYNQLGNTAGPRFGNSTVSSPLGGTFTTLGGMGLLTAGSFVYGMVKKRPQELRIGYVGAAALATLPVATDLWLNGGKRYGNLTTQGMTGTYISLIAPPVIAIFAGSLLGNSIASGVSKPTTRKKSWYQGRYARSGKRRVKTQKRAKQRKKLQDKQNKRRD